MCGAVDVFLCLVFNQLQQNDLCVELEPGLHHRRRS